MCVNKFVHFALKRYFISETLRCFWRILYFLFKISMKEIQFSFLRARLLHFDNNAFSFRFIGALLARRINFPRCWPIFTLNTECPSNDYKQCKIFCAIVLCVQTD
jgi:hypothetical protein